MTEVTEHRLLAKPLKDAPHSDKEKNIFANLNSSDRLPALAKMKGKEYHAIGPRSLRKKIIESE